MSAEKERFNTPPLAAERNPLKAAVGSAPALRYDTFHYYRQNKQPFKTGEEMKIAFFPLYPGG